VLAVLVERVLAVLPDLVADQVLAAVVLLLLGFMLLAVFFLFGVAVFLPVLALFLGLGERRAMRSR
jgi:hypothetical protein